MTQGNPRDKVQLQTKLLGSSAQKAKKSDVENVNSKESVLDDSKDEYVKIFDANEKLITVYTSGELRPRESDQKIVSGPSQVPITVPFRDSFKMTLVFDDYITNTTSAAFYCSIAPQVKDCHGWSSITTYWSEYKINSICMIADLAKPGERHGSYATGRPSFVYGYSPVALTSFQKALDNKHIQWLDPCPGKYITKHVVKNPSIYGGSSPKLHAPSFQLCSEATNFHNGYFTIACNESSDMVTGFPIAWYFDVTFRSRCDPY